MLIDKKILENNLKDLFGKKVTHAKLSYGSFFSIDFGNDIKILVATNKGEKSIIRGEWRIWIYMTFWEFKKNGKALLDCEDNQEKIAKLLKNLEGKTLLDFEITSDDFSAVVKFDDGVDLYLIPNDKNDGYEQWKLTIPGGKVLVAGPGNALSIRE